MHLEFGKVHLISNHKLDARFGKFIPGWVFILKL